MFTVTDSNKYGSYWTTVFLEVIILSAFKGHKMEPHYIHRLTVVSLTEIHNKQTTNNTMLREYV